MTTESKTPTAAPKRAPEIVGTRMRMENYLLTIESRDYTVNWPLGRLAPTPITLDAFQAGGELQYRVSDSSVGTIQIVGDTLVLANGDGARFQVGPVAASQWEFFESVYNQLNR